MANEKELKIPSALQPLLTSSHHAADRAWTSLQSFIVVNSVLILAWTQVSNGDLLATVGQGRFALLIALSTFGIFFGVVWSGLCSRMWHYHLEFNEQVLHLTAQFQEDQQGAGASGWKITDSKVSSYWRDQSFPTFVVASGNQVIMFVGPLIVAILHLFMMHWTLTRYCGDAHAVDAMVWIVFLFVIMVSDLWQFVEPIMTKTYFVPSSDGPISKD